MTKKKVKGYFYDDEESAIISYINEKDAKVKNEIFNVVLYPAFTKMIESIIRRYKLYVKDEDFEQTFMDTLSYLLTKIDHFRPKITHYEEMSKITDEAKSTAINVSEQDFRCVYKDEQEKCPNYLCVESTDDDGNVTGVKYYKKIEKKYKAYSYCGTVCKHYLLQRNIHYKKELDRTSRYDVLPDEILDSMGYYSDSSASIKTAEKLIKKTSDEIRDMLTEPEENGLNRNETKVGAALLNLLDNWDTIFIGDESNKLQKSSVLYFLREQTMMSTKELRENMKPFKSLYYMIKYLEFK